MRLSPTILGTCGGSFGCSGNSCLAHLRRKGSFNSVCKFHCGKICRCSGCRRKHNKATPIIGSTGKGIMGSTGKGPLPVCFSCFGLNGGECRFHNNSTVCRSVGRSKAVSRLSVICLKGSGPGLAKNFNAGVAFGGFSVDTFFGFHCKGGVIGCTHVSTRGVRSGGGRSVTMG